MRIEYKLGEDDDGYTHDSMEVFIKDNRVYSNHVYPLTDCPEDAIIGRDLVSCYDIIKAMEIAYNAGKNGEEWIYTEIEDNK